MMNLFFIVLISASTFAYDVVSQNSPEWYACHKDTDCQKVTFNACGGIPLANKKHLEIAGRYNHYMASVSNCAPAIHPPKILSQKIVCLKNVCSYKTENEKNNLK